MPFSQAAATTGPAEYPPTPITRSGPNPFKILPEVTRLAGSITRAFIWFTMPLFFRPWTEMGSNLNPFSPKTVRSNGLPVPMKSTSL